MKNNWRTFPTEHPTETGEYLCRGIGGLNNKLYYYVCLWIGECNDRQIANRFFMAATSLMKFRVEFLSL